MHRGYRGGEQFQSTLPVWGGTRQAEKIAALQAISIHPPRVGRDRHPVPKRCCRWSFQSTLPVWGGTVQYLAQLWEDVRFQSTLPVWGGTLPVLVQHRLDVISIHPPRVGRDHPG